MDLSKISTAKIPLGWALALLAGCATFTTAAFSAGAYFGAGDAEAAALTARVSKLERAVEQIPEMAAGIARLEGAMGTRPNNRIPAGGRNE